jgi:translation initiation factor IF-2
VTHATFVICAVEREGGGRVCRGCVRSGTTVVVVRDGDVWGSVRSLDYFVSCSGDLMAGDFMAARLEVVSDRRVNSEGLVTQRTFQCETIVYTG